MADSQINIKHTRQLLKRLLWPEVGFFKVAIIYGLAIGLLTLAVPIAVQTLINSIANIGSIQAVMTLALVLFLTLFFSGIFSALRTQVMEHYERRVYVRLTTELSMRTILAPHSFFEGRRNASITQHYFDIMTLQKNVPSLVVDGFALILQLLIGFTLVSFYHPAFFVFNTIIILLMFLAWKVWGRAAKRTAIELSKSKYATAKWLDGLATAQEFFKSSRHLDYAGRKTDELISGYVQSHENHFKFTFSQTLTFLLLYATASASLLGLGGWLVVQGQLSIGQLVAAELILSAVFFGISQFTNYLKLYYELYGAADKIGIALEMPQEPLHEDQKTTPENATLRCQNLQLSHLEHHSELNFTIEAGSKVFITSNNAWVQRTFINLLRFHETPEQGWLKLGGRDLSEYDVYELRQAIATIDRSLIIECTIREYLNMAATSVSLADISDVLEILQLNQVINALPDGLNTRLSALGNPLQPAEFLLLKLAAVLLSKPKVVALHQHFDNLPEAARVHALHVLDKQPFTVLYFTHRPVAGVFDHTFNWTEGVNPAEQVRHNDSQGGSLE